MKKARAVKEKVVQISAYPNSKVMEGGYIILEELPEVEQTLAEPLGLLGNFSDTIN